MAAFSAFNELGAGFRLASQDLESRGAGELLGDFPEVYNFLAWINARNFKWQDKSEWYRSGIDLSEGLQWEGGRQTSLTIQKRRLNKSIELLNRAIEKDTNFYNAYWGLSIINRNLKEFNTGIENLNKCIELKPRLLINYLSRGVMYTDLNLFQKSVDDFYKVIEIATESHKMKVQDSIDLLGAYALLSGTYRMWRKYDESLEYGFKGNKLQDKLMADGFSGFPACLINISYSYRGKGDVENAIKYGIALIDEYGNYSRSFGDTGALFLDLLKRYKEADWLFKKAIELNPEAYWIYTYMVTNYELHKKYNDGIEFFSELKKNRPKDSNISFS
jgi:tetratricopeptide (TPR) repeat protein